MRRCHRSVDADDADADVLTQTSWFCDEVLLTHSFCDRCVVCGRYVDMTPLDHAGQLLAHLQSHWEEVGGARRTAHVLEFLNRGARDESKTQGDRANYYYTSAVLLLHRLGYIVPWESSTQAGSLSPSIRRRPGPGRCCD